MDGISFATDFCMARKLEDLLVYQKAKELDVAVSAILSRPAWRNYLKLQSQLSESSASVGANIEEGFEQGTDRHFARYLETAKGSAAETAGHLSRAVNRGCITESEAQPPRALAFEICRMLAPLISYLKASDFKDRGNFLDRQRIRRKNPETPTSSHNDTSTE